MKSTEPMGEMAPGMKRGILIIALACSVLLGAVWCANGAGRGKLTILTYPVTGEVVIDGKKLGAAPLMVTLEGEHAISFSEYSSQYLTPPARTVRIGAGDTTVVIGVFLNRFIPARSPEGFSPADSVRIYGTKERKLKDGTIFDYVDGGALVYLRHGLRETTHAVYQGTGKSTLTLDIFDMGTPAGAQAGFDDPEICSAGHSPCDIGAPCKSYLYEPDYFLYFYKSNFLVYIATNNDSLKTAVESFAAALCRNIP